MLLRFRVLPLVFFISLLSGCGLASKAFYSAGDKLFQPGDDTVASMQTYSVAQFLQPFTLNPAKASSDYLGKWVKVRGVIVDIRRMSGIAGSYYFTVTMRDEQNKTDKRLTFNFGSHNSADVESLSNGSIATIIGQVHQVQDSTVPTLQNPKVVK
ncbi:OB-fold putative lipoprotein [Klebsiella quasipneumoniae subsp. similipneumoniae]|uniref:OB-fold putative lipoprotein n=1 Tax=Klebsiella quasipneumoniae TaxID=1463165 RepID=UPI0035AEA549